MVPRQSVPDGRQAGRRLALARVTLLAVVAVLAATTTRARAGTTTRVSLAPGAAQANSFRGQPMREKIARRRSKRKKVGVAAQPTRRRDTISSVNALVPAVKIITRTQRDFGYDRHGLARLLHCSVAPPSLGAGLRRQVQVWSMADASKWRRSNHPKLGSANETKGPSLDGAMKES